MHHDFCCVGEEGNPCRDLDVGPAPSLLPGREVGWDGWGMVGKRG